MASDKIQRNIQLMVLKWFFDRLVSLIGLLVVWPVLLIVAIMIKVKMPGGPAIFTQKRVGKGAKLFTCHKFRTMTVAPKVSEGSNGSKGSNWSSVSVAGDSRMVICHSWGLGLMCQGVRTSSKEMTGMC